MAAGSSTNSGFSKLSLAQKVYTATATVTTDIRSILLNSTTAFTLTFPAPGDAGEVWFISNISSTASAATHTLTAATGVTWDGTNQSISIAPGDRLVAVSNSATGYEVYRFGPETVIYTGNGAIAIPNSKFAVIGLSKAGVLAATLAAPTVGADDGKVLWITALTANAHTVTQTAPGFNGASTSGDVATFGGAIGDSFAIVAFNGKWNVISLRNVTLG